MLAKNRHVSTTRLRRGLVLERASGQQVVLDLPDGGECVITSRISGPGRVRLHIAAPPAVHIRRGELAPLATNTKTQSAA